MFTKFAIVALSALTIGVSASPISKDTQSLSRRYDWPSFDSWGGISSLSNFDSFYGSEDFAHVSFTQTVTEQESSTLVCHSESIVIIQQRLAVLQEMAKRIITEQVCEVETQVVVFEQFHASLGGFSRDLRHYSSYQPGYDNTVAGYYGDLVGSDGSLTTNDLGFSGSDVGSNTYVVSGNNWNDATSPVSVGNIYDAAQSAYVSQN